jgi:adenylate cyclase
VRRTDRVAECHAAMVQGTILVAAGDKEDTEARRLLAHADQLLRISGAAYFEPQLSQLRLRLDGNGR